MSRALDFFRKNPTQIVTTTPPAPLSSRLVLPTRSEKYIDDDKLSESSPEFPRFPGIGSGSRLLTAPMAVLRRPGLPACGRSRHSRRWGTWGTRGTFWSARVSTEEILPRQTLQAPAPTTTTKR